MAGLFTSIPVVDFAQSKSPDTRPIFLSKLRGAIINVGFFYLKGHSIPDDVQHGLLAQARRFFDLPAEKKQDVDIINSKHFLGFTDQNLMKSLQTPDRRETYVVGMDQIPPAQGEPLYHNLRGPNLWPAESDIPGFRRAIHKYRDEVSQLAHDFKSLIAEALGLEPKSFEGLFNDPPDNRLMLARYAPPPASSDDESLFQGIGAHRDSSFLTFLLLVTPHTALEVRNNSGIWIPVSPRPDTLVVNIGRQLESLTQGICKATCHRVSCNKQNYQDSDGNPLGPRYTFPFFQSLDLDVSPENTSIEIPNYIVNMGRNAQALPDNGRVSQEITNSGVGKGAFHVRAFRHHWVAEKWYPGLLDDVRRTRMEMRSKSSIAHIQRVLH